MFGRVVGRGKDSMCVCVCESVASGAPLRDSGVGGLDRDNEIRPREFKGGEGAELGRAVATAESGGERERSCEV